MPTAVDQVSQVDVTEIKKTFSTLTLEKAVPALIVLAVGIVAVFLLTKLFDRLMSRTQLEKSLSGFLRSLIRILLYVIVVLVALGTLGLNVSSLVAILSVASLAITLAIQGTLSNIAGGIQVLTAKPFRVGEYVEIGGVEGTVSEIGMIYTRLVTLDNKALYLPNSDVAASKVSNYTVEGMRRIDLPFTASYDCDCDAVRDALAQAARRGGALTDPAPAAFVRAYDESAIRYELQFWCEPKNYWPTYFAVTAAVREEFNRAGLVMTYPHLNVHFDPPPENKENGPAAYQIASID